MEMSLRIYPSGPRGPYLRELKSDKENELTFDGYFYYDQKELPIQRVLMRFSGESTDEEGNTYRTAISTDHIEIYEKLSGEDTSVFYNETKEDTEDDEHICFFPTEITTLKYRVIKSDLTDLERDLVYGVIADEEKEHEQRRLNIMISRAQEAEQLE
jgi:hypothetical protein